MATTNDIDALLPQTQCRECGYPSCHAYAQALRSNTTTINLCAPGGVATLHALGTLLNIDPTPYMDNLNTREPGVAKIREAECIGCTKCIQACPVDAIIGRSKHMHTIIDYECTGCGLCLEPCPVDCIDIIPLQNARYSHKTARTRFDAKESRLLQNTLKTNTQDTSHNQNETQAHDKQQMRDDILAAITRSKTRKHNLRQ